VPKSILECINANCRFVWRGKLLPSPLQSSWDLVILGSTAKTEFIELSGASSPASYMLACYVDLFNNLRAP
jgi:hypothetical protein